MRGPLDLERRGTHEEDIRRGYAEVEARLVAAGFPETSPWWFEVFDRWWESGKRQLVPRVGRRGGKSSSLSRLAVVEALYGHHDVPPGDTGWVAIISTDRSEASGRMRTICAILDALGIAWKPAYRLSNAIELVGRRIGFRVFTASIGGVSGFTAIFVLCDEVAKWMDEDTGSNPATEVLASVGPTMETMLNARIVLSSSPWGMLDAHYDAFEKGDTELQMVCWAATWIANPSTTEEKTRISQPDEARWEREYAAIPMAQAETSLLSALLVDRGTRKPPQHWTLPPEHGHRYAAFIDPATRGHAWTLVIVTRGSDRVKRIAFVKEWRGTRKMPLSPGKVFAEIATIAERYPGARALRSDQWSEDALAEIARGYGLSLLCDEPWTSVRKREGYEAVLSALQEGTLELHPDPQVKADLLGVRKKLTRNGVTYELVEQNGRHSDYAPAIAMAALESIAVGKDQDLRPTEEKLQAAKREWLEQRAKDRKRAQRSGGLPVTHRRASR